MKVCNKPVTLDFFVLRFNTAQQNEVHVHFTLHVNHHARGQGLLTLHVHIKGVRRSNMNEISLLKEKDFPVIPVAPHVNKHCICCNTFLIKSFNDQ